LIFLIREDIKMSDLITKDLIVVDLEVNTKEEAINELAKVIEMQGRLINFDGFVKQVFKREEDFPTAIGFDVAIPHGKCDSVKSSTLAFAKLKNGIQWSEEENVKYVFLIAVPESEAGNTHLQILAQISRKLMREEFREELNNAKEINEFLELLSM
jgi:PTS system fructose-specific IIA component